MSKLAPVDELTESDGTVSPSRSLDPKHPASMDSQDPREWSSTRKTLLFVALMSSSLLADGYIILRAGLIPVVANLDVEPWSGVQHWSLRKRSTGISLLITRRPV